MRGGSFIASWLRAQDVTHLFVVCGEHILPLLDGCEDAGIRVIGCRHEQAAVIAAEGYARATGRPGVAAVTAGPGVTNAVTGLAVATSSGSPVMLLAGRTSPAKQMTGAFQDIDGTAIVASVVKWAQTAQRADRLDDYLGAAWRRMVGGRPGGVFIELPHDALMGEIDREPEKLRLPEPAGASPAAVAAAIAMLSEAERPAIIAGSGAFWAGAGDALRAFAERARIPVATLNAARGLVPDGGEVVLGPLSEAGLVLAQADVVVLAGTKLDVSVTFGGPPLFTGATPKFVQIDVEPTSVGLNRAPELGILGDARVVFEQLAEAWDAKPKDAWLAQAKELGTAMHGAWESQSAPLTGSPVPPGRAVHEVLTQAGREAILISDGGDIHTWAITTFPAFRPGSLLSTHDALGTIGVGVPYAIGAKAAAPDRPVVVCIGDGSFGFCAMELETAARNDLPITVVVMNNGGWGNIRHEQNKQFGRLTSATSLSVASYEKIAEALGGYGERVESADEVGPAIRRAIDSGKPAVVNVITQPGVVSAITDMVGDMMSML